MSLFLGMDGGGTKTAFTLIDADATVVSSHRQESLAWPTSSIPEVQSAVRTGVDTVLDGAGATRKDVTCAFFGIPGYGEDSTRTAALDDLGLAVLGHRRYRCDNDMISGWAGSLDGRDGINVTVGTGSIAYGAVAGRSCRIGGWGELFGDEGSGYWVSVQALNAFSRMADGRQQLSVLYTMLREHLGLTEDLDAIGVMLNSWRGERRRIASLAPVVVAAAEAGDDVARGILTEAADQVRQLASASADRLGIDPRFHVAVTTSGGMAGASAMVPLIDRALRTDPRLHPAESVHGPELGSALYALRLCRQGSTEVAS